MKNTIIILAFICFTFFANAQNCNEAAIENVPGTWTTSDNSAIKNSGANLVMIKSVAAIADNMMRPGFQVPKGLVARYFTAFQGINDYIYIGNDLAQYEYSNWFNHFMCYSERVTKNPDAQLILSIKFNDPGVIFSRDVLPGPWEDNEKDHFGWLDNFPNQKNGIIYLKATPDSAQFTRQPDRWLLTYDGKLPYAYVSRLEYLQKRKEKLGKTFNKDMDNTKLIYPLRPKAEQEKEKNEALQKFKDEAAQGSGDWTNRYLQNYRTDEQKQEEYFKANTERYNKSLLVVEHLLKMPDNELQKTAIVSDLGEFTAFSNEGDVGAHILIKENREYYNNKLAKAVPQVIFVSLTRYDGSKKANYIAAYNEIVRRLDFEKLKTLIGK